MKTNVGAGLARDGGGSVTENIDCSTAIAGKPGSHI
jgi:hypothetical protein